MLQQELVCGLHSCLSFPYCSRAGPWTFYLSCPCCSRAGPWTSYLSCPYCSRAGPWTSYLSCPCCSRAGPWTFYLSCPCCSRAGPWTFYLSCPCCSRAGPWTSYLSCPCCSRACPWPSYFFFILSMLQQSLCVDFLFFLSCPCCSRAGPWTSFILVLTMLQHNWSLDFLRGELWPSVKDSIHLESGKPESNLSIPHGGFSPVQSRRTLETLVPLRLPCQAPGAIGSELGLVGLVSVCFDRVRSNV